jgi:hypothetical protein
MTVIVLGRILCRFVLIHESLLPFVSKKGTFTVNGYIEMSNTLVSSS